jgi:hypothetical protein
MSRGARVALGLHLLVPRSRLPAHPATPPRPQDIAKRDHERRVASMTAWTDEELRLLDKAIKKWPMGTPKRCVRRGPAPQGVGLGGAEGEEGLPTRLCPVP